MSSIPKQAAVESAEDCSGWRVARRRRLLRAAIEVLREESAAAASAGDISLDEISMDEIARAAGVGKATLYRYFHTKQGLLRACLEDVVEELGLRMDATESADAPAPERLRRIIGVMVDAFSQDLLPLRLLTGRRGELDEEWRRSIQHARQRLVSVLDRHFRRGAGEGFYRELDLALVPHFIMGMIRSGIGHSSRSNGALTDGIYDYVLRGSLAARDAQGAGP